MIYNNNFYHSIMKILKFFLEIFFNFILFFILLLPLWLNKKFGFVYYDQLLLNLELSSLGLLDGDYRLFRSGVRWLVIIPLILSILLYLIRYLFLKQKFNRNEVKKILIKSVDSIFSKRKKNKLLISLNKLFKISISIPVYFFLILIVSFYFYYNLTYIFKKNDTNNNQNSYLDKNYIYPKVDKFSKKNLIVIYVESLEETFTNKNIFGENLLKEISALPNSSKVKNFYQIPETGFSIYSLIASQCGIPLLKFGILEARQIGTLKKFLPNLTCLSDILKKNNYINTILTSDDSRHGGYDVFGKTHGFDEIIDSRKLKDLNYRTSRSAWHRYEQNWYGGIHDNTLYQALIDILKKKKILNKNFFISVHTIDTHSPKGYPNPKCLRKILKKAEINNFDFTHSFICSSRYLEKFIKEYNKLKMANTNLVIIGDHLFMQSFDEVLEKDRKIFNSFLINQKFKIMRNDMNVFDLFPSFLNLAGVTLKNEQQQAGLGYSIFINNEEYKIINKPIKNQSNIYKKFWNEKKNY